MGCPGPLPSPERVGADGYVCYNDFDPPLPEVHPNAPSIWIDPVQWLWSTLCYFNVHGFIQEVHPVGGDGGWQGSIQFTIPVSRDGGRPLHINAVGGLASAESIALKYAVAEALKLLAPYGYIIPSYCSAVVEAMNQDGLFYDIEEYCLAKARGNASALVEDCQMTMTGCSFEATFEQVMQKCQHEWEYGYHSPALTNKGYQDKLVARPIGSDGAPCLVVVSRPCETPAEATESALCTALDCVHRFFGYIGDLDFVTFIIKKVQLQNGD